MSIARRHLERPQVQAAERVMTGMAALPAQVCSVHPHLLRAQSPRSPRAISFQHVGGGGGGSETAQPNNTGIGGDGANGTFMMWFKVITPATVSTPYYSLSASTLM